MAIFWKKVKKIPRACGVFLIRWYQRTLSPDHGWIRVFIGFHGRCRFVPTCSQYAEQSILFHGLFRGSLMALRRLLRCHPWARGGWDPVEKTR